MQSQENSHDLHTRWLDQFPAIGQIHATQTSTICLQTVALQVAIALAIRLHPNTKRRPAATSDIDP